MIKKFHANQMRLRRHRRMRSHMAGSELRPRLSVYRSGGHIYAQVIDDSTGKTLAAASSLDEILRSFQPAKKETSAQQAKAEQEEDATVEMAAEAAPTRSKGAKAAPKAPQGKSAQGKGAQSKGGRPAQAKIVLPSAQKGAKKTQAEALAAIADNRKVAIAREVGKLVAQRAKEQGVSKVVFDRGGYAYHGRVAALAEGAREVGLEF